MGKVIQKKEKNRVNEECKNKIDTMRWSYSRINSFNHCKYEFFLNYIVDDDEEYLSEGNFYTDLGIFVHEILAKIFGGQLSVDEAPQYYIDNFDNFVFYKTDKRIMDKRFEACADYFSSVNFDWINDYNILGVELEVNFKIEKYNFVGYIDLLLQHKESNDIILIDHKSTSFPVGKSGNILKKSESSFESYKRQMYLYCKAVKQRFGKFPSIICWNHFCDGGLFMNIPFNQQEYHNSIKWFTKTIKEIGREEDFEPNQNFFYCNTLCNFRSSCEYVKSGV